VKITADTNVLLRAIIGDDARQASVAQGELDGAAVVALPSPALCELVWVLSRTYKIPAADISAKIRLLINAANVVVNRPAVEAGLEVLDSGGDFADGVIAFEGRWLGGGVFVSFDRKAARLVQAQGEAARLLV